MHNTRKLKFSALVLSLLLLISLTACTGGTESSVEELLSYPDESQEEVPVVLIPGVSELNHPILNMQSDDSNLKDMEVKFFFDNTYSNYGYVTKDETNSFILANNFLIELFESYEKEYSADVYFKKLFCKEQSEYLTWNDISKTDFNFKNKSYYTGHTGGVQGYFQGDVGPLQELVANEELSCSGLNVVVTDLNEQNASAESLASEIAKITFATPDTTVGIITVMSPFNGEPCVYSNAIINEAGKTTHSKGSYKGIRPFYIIYFGNTSCVLDFQNRLLNKLGDDEKVKFGNNETFESEEDFKNRIYESGSLYYFCDYVSYANGLKSFGVEDYNKMISNSSLFDFQKLNYQSIFYESKEGKGNFFDDKEIDYILDSTCVSSLNSPNNFMTRIENIRNIFQIDDGEYYYSLNYSAVPNPETDSEEQISLETFLVKNYNKDISIYVAIPVSSDANEVYYIQKQGIEINFKEIKTESSEEGEETEESEVVEADEEHKWVKKHYAQLFASDSLVVSYYDPDKSEFVQIVGDTNTEPSVTTDYVIYYPEVTDGRVTTKEKVIEGTNIILKLSVKDISEFTDSYDYLNVRIPLRVNTRTKTSISNVPDYIKYLNVSGTSYSPDGKNNDSFFSRTVDLADFYNSFFANSFSDEEYKSIFDCEICNVVMNVKLK